MPREPKVYRTPPDPGFVGGYNWSAMLTGLGLLVAVNIAATQFVAYQFRYQAALGAPLFIHSGHSIYQPTSWAFWLLQHSNAPSLQVKEWKLPF